MTDRDLQLADVVERHRDEIVRAWEQRVARELGERLGGNELRDSMPALLDALVPHLRGAPDGAARATRVSRHHARQRRDVHVDLARTLREYGAAREAILDVAERHGSPPRTAELRRLGEALDASIAAAAEAYVARRDAASAALEARLREVADHAPVAVFAKDAAGRYVFANRWVAALFGLTPDRIVGRTAADLLPPDVVERTRERERRVASGGEVVTEDVVPTVDGERVLATVRFPFRLSATEVGTFGIAVDVTERKRAEEAVRAANERLVEADRRKDEFLGMLSHELRNPLAPIRNAVYILQRADPASEQARRAREVIARQSDHLTRLVDDLLDVTRIARGKIALRPADVDVAAVVTRTAEDHRSLFSDRGIALDVRVPEGPLRASADPTRLAQIVGNLLQNAAKFTPSGGRVSVRAGASPRGIELAVRDTGVGIDPRVRERIFDPFVQEEGTLARTGGGLGLGLALVKGLAELHGGGVEVESDGPGRGAEFRVWLPSGEGARPPAPAEAEVPGARRARRVLVVDDNRDAAESLAELLAAFGHEVEVAHDGPSALARARASHHDFVLCDIGLPGMTGYDVARALRADPGAGFGRLVAVSGYAQPEDQQRAAEAGFDLHVAKPPDPAALDRLLSG